MQKDGQINLISQLKWLDHCFYRNINLFLEKSDFLTSKVITSPFTFLIENMDLSVTTISQIFKKYKEVHMRIHKIFRTPNKNTVLLLSEAKINVVQLLIHVLLFRPGDCSMPGFLFLHYLLEFSQTHVHWVGKAIQTSHPQY